MGKGKGIGIGKGKGIGIGIGIQTSRLVWFPSPSPLHLMFVSFLSSPLAGESSCVVRYDYGLSSHDYASPYR